MQPGTPRAPGFEPPAPVFPAQPSPPDPAPATAGDSSPITIEQAAAGRALVIELANRQIEAIRLYEPLPMQHAFHASAALERLVRGSNRSGKTLATCVEVARAVTGQDPYHKYPLKDGRAFLVAKDGRHIGQVIARKLFRAGAFKIIRDLETGRWRAFRLWEPGDRARLECSRPAPPLIPQRFIKSFSWEKKKDFQPTLVTLHNGWEISFFSSLGKPPGGSDLDLAMFDEEIIDPEWYGEMQARLLDRNGLFIWSATPQAGTEHLYDLHERCEKEEGSTRPVCQEFFVTLHDNKHISEEAKHAFAEKIGDRDEAAVRIGGEFAVAHYRVYPEFSTAVHGVPYRVIPSDWTRYMVVDPGHQVCAVLFAAVTPKDHGDFVVLYDELYLRGCDATMFAEEVGRKVDGYQVHEFIMDYHAARTTQVAAGRTIEQQYSDALRAKNIRSVSTGFDFTWGSDDVKAGLAAARAWMRSREGGGCKLQVMTEKCPNFVDEIKRYHYKRIAGVTTDMPDQKRHNHLMDALRYLAMRNPLWVRPSKGKSKLHGAVAAFRQLQKKRREKQGQSTVRLGPGRSRWR